jgi:hypothetical protein
VALTLELWATVTVTGVESLGWAAAAAAAGLVAPSALVDALRVSFAGAAGWSPVTVALPALALSGGPPTANASVLRVEFYAALPLPPLTLLLPPVEGGGSAVPPGELGAAWGPGGAAAGAAPAGFNAALSTARAAAAAALAAAATAADTTASGPRAQLVFDCTAPGVALLLPACTAAPGAPLPPRLPSAFNFPIADALAQPRVALATAPTGGTWRWAVTAYATGSTMLRFSGSPSAAASSGGGGGGGGGTGALPASFDAAMDSPLYVGLLAAGVATALGGAAVALRRAAAVRRRRREAAKEALRGARTPGAAADAAQYDDSVREENPLLRWRAQVPAAPAPAPAPYQQAVAAPAAAQLADSPQAAPTASDPVLFPAAAPAAQPPLPRDADAPPVTAPAWTVSNPLLLSAARSPAALPLGSPLLARSAGRTAYLIPPAPMEARAVFAPAPAAHTRRQELPAHRFTINPLRSAKPPGHA